MKHVLDPTQIQTLEPQTAFVFQLDRLRPRKIYYFNECTGSYAQIFESERHMKENKNPAHVSCSTVVLEVVE